MFECSLKVGLRATECATLKENLIINPTSNETVMVNIGPEQRVETKYSKQRTVEFPYELMRRLYLYKTSNKRLKLVDKGNENGVFKGDLFITTKGTCMSGETLSKYFINYAQTLQIMDAKFNHQHHNLRSTFATNYLEDELAKGRDFYLAAADLQALMGHENLLTTMEYVDFMKDEEKRKKHVNTKSDIVESAMKEGVS